MTMKTMKTKKTNTAPWLHSIQYRHGEDSFSTIEASIIRTHATVEKINSLMDKVLMLESQQAIPIGSYHEHIGGMVAIRDSIGVYGIYHPRHGRRKNEPNMLWYKEELTSEGSSSFDKEGKLWRDYFGDNSLASVGGWVVVSLSDKGISFLNGIASIVASSYITTE